MTACAGSPRRVRAAVPVPGRRPCATASTWTGSVIPEEIREQRHQRRNRLSWLDFGSLGGGLRLAPSRVLPATRKLVEQLSLQAHVDLFHAHYEAFADTSALVDRRWDVGRMRAAYRAYLEEFAPVLATYRTDDPAEDPARAFANYVAGLHEWRKLPYVDPASCCHRTGRGRRPRRCSSRSGTCSNRWRGITSRTN